MLTILFTSLAMLSTLAGGFAAIRFRRRIHLLMGFGAGVLLGATFFDLLPESVAIAEEQNWNSKYVFAVVVAGFLVFYLIERVLILHACPEGDCENEAHKQVGRMGAIGLIAHSTLDGMAIGAASLVGWQTCLLIALAVVAHDSSDGLNTILIITRGEPVAKGDVVFLILDAVAPGCRRIARARFAAFAACARRLSGVGFRFFPYGLAIATEQNHTIFA